MARRTIEFERMPLTAPHDVLLRGRVHLSGVDLLAPKLTPANADELIAAGLDRSKDEIASMLAVRFPKPDLPTRFECTAFRVPNKPEPCAAIASEKYEVVPEPPTPGAMDDATREANAHHAARAIAQLDRLLATRAPSAAAGQP